MMEKLVDCICKECGQTLPEPTNSPIRGAKQTMIFEAVQKAGRYGISIEGLFERLYAGDVNGGPNSGRHTIHTFVHKMNKKLKPFGKRIAGRRGSADSRYVLEVYDGTSQRS